MSASNGAGMAEPIRRRIESMKRITPGANGEHSRFAVWRDDDGTYSLLARGSGRAPTGHAGMTYLEAIARQSLLDAAFLDASGRCLSCGEIPEPTLRYCDCPPNDWTSYDRMQDALDAREKLASVHPLRVGRTERLGSTVRRNECGAGGNAT